MCQTETPTWLPTLKEACINIKLVHFKMKEKCRIWFVLSCPSDTIDFKRGLLKNDRLNSSLWPKLEIYFETSHLIWL
jgi:hypothetical protein